MIKVFHCSSLCGIEGLNQEIEEFLKGKIIKNIYQSVLSKTVYEYVNYKEKPDLILTIWYEEEKINE